MLFKSEWNEMASKYDWSQNNAGVYMIALEIIAADAPRDKRRILQ